MALKVKAVERLLKFDKNDPGSYRYVLKPELILQIDTTGILITCYDRTGKEVKRVTSISGEVEDPDSGGSGTDSETDPSAPSTSSGTESGTVHNGSGIIPTPTDPEDDQPGD